MVPDMEKKYIKIREDIKKEIVSGKIKAGDQLTSENKLCEQYQVSRHTVRKAISELINMGFLTSIHGKGTFCTERTRYTGTSNNIGVITTYISDYIFPHVIKGIDEVLSKNGYSIILKSTGNNQKVEEKCLEDILHKNIDGLIIEPSKSDILNRNIYLYKKLEEYNIPYVFIQGIYEQLSDKPSVLLDDKYGAYLATKHLLDTGRRHLLGIFKFDDYQGKERHKGYIQALVEAGIPYDPDRVITYHTEDRKMKPALVLKELLAKGTRIEGIVCYNDQIASLIYQELSALQRKVPDDIAVIGYDNSYLSAGNHIPLSSIHHPKDELGRIAANLLLDIIHGKVEKENYHKVILPELVIRESTRQKP